MHVTVDFSCILHIHKLGIFRIYYFNSISLCLSSIIQFYLISSVLPFTASFSYLCFLPVSMYFPLISLCRVFIHLPFYYFHPMIVPHFCTSYILFHMSINWRGTFLLIGLHECLFFCLILISSVHHTFNFLSLTLTTFVPATCPATPIVFFF